MTRARGTATSNSETLIITVASPPDYIPLSKVFLVAILGSLILMPAVLLKNRGKNTSPKKWRFIF